jgi:hypothetical protein
MMTCCYPATGKQIQIAITNSGLFPSKLVHKTSTDYFKWLVSNKVLAVTYHFFSIPGYKPNSQADFQGRDNAWCVVEHANGRAASGELPLLFTKNLAITNMSDVAGSQLTGDPPFGREGVVFILMNGGTKTLKENEVRQYLSNLNADNQVVRP